MINHISIKNFAIIENAEIDFEEGLNIITGETGAGKSIAVEAISLALGSRADTSSIRTGTDKAVVQLQGILDGEEIVIVREVSQSGKNLCKLNGEIVTLAQLNKVSKRLADIHGQYDNQSLLNPDYHIELLDTYQIDKIMCPREKVQAAFESYSKTKSELIKLLNTERENKRQLEFYKYEVNEITNANLVIGEDKELTDRISILQNSEKIFENVENSYSILASSSGSALDSLGTIFSSLEDIARYSDELNLLKEDFGDCYYKLQDVASKLRSVKEDLTFSPSELDEAISRLNLIDDLKKKYGSTIEEILEYKDDLASKLSRIENFDEEKLRLERALVSDNKALLEACKELSDVRHEVKADLEVKIRKELLDLNFPNSNIEIKIDRLERPTENGYDHVEILISTNKGEPLKPLYKVASGGEMSRIMLAFKNVISTYDKIPTLIFDEIDNGISGITASIVAKKLRDISDDHQIICITHLPQIAAAGDSNYRIHKHSDDSATYTSIDKLDESATVQEIARLLGGTNITETTLKSAQELIASTK